MNKSVLATAVALAVCTPFAVNAQWVDPSDDVTVYQAEDLNGTNNPWIKTETLTKNELNELVFSGEAVHDTTGAKGNALLLAKKDETIVNNGTLWLRGSGNGDVMATSYSTNGTVINRGTIYVSSSSNFEANKAITVNPNGTGINEGTIVVGDNASGLLDASGEGTKTLINKGTISVIGNGVGIAYRMEGGADYIVRNEKDIIVTGNGTGVYLSAERATPKTFTNTGRISATEGGIAIADYSTGTTINLEGENSNIEGKVIANETTTFNFTNNTDTLELAANPLTPEDTVAKAGAIDTTNSHVTVELGSGAESLKIGTVTTDTDSSTTFSLARMGSAAAKVLTVTNVAGEGALNVQYTGEVSDELVAGAQSADLFNGISLGNYALQQVSVAEGAWGDAAVYSLNADGSVNADILGTNSLLSSATDLALMNGLVWRSQLSNLSDRMGTLRTMPEAAGLWVRYNNGRLEGRGIEHDYNVIELGVDTPVSNNFLFGVSFDYTIGDTDLNAGSADNDTYTIGMYGSYFADNGAFIDMMAKIGRIDSEYDLNNGISEKGDYMMTGAIVGVEAGHRFDINSFFVEPQVQLTYSWLRASDYTTNVRSVAFDTVESLVARVGVMGGVKFAENRGAAYLKASYNHDFLGDVDARFTDGAHTRDISDELDDNWGEVSLGASYSLTKSLNAFVDVGTGFGGDIDQKWRVNVGGKYVF